ncbi:ACE transcription factor 2 [Lentinula edodes]|uniref:ACE transcription factor 2 n=1 Tax=Lentinula edodes TaxID=5353 RepID=A0A1Q3EPR9_LENED|nr:ACE transcription factor 2 [Lentinula edodes]
MVFVNSKKFACEACIKGHRSSTCSHTDRPLFEVKKKGPFEVNLQDSFPLLQLFLTVLKMSSELHLPLHQTHDKLASHIFYYKYRI